MKTRIKNQVLVIGGAGFIGSHLTEKLCSMGCRPTVLDNLSSGVFENIQSKDLVKFVKGDVTNLQLVEKLIRHVDVVFHLAEYIPNTQQYGPGHIIRYSSENPYLQLELSARGILNVIEAARKHHARVVYASSASVYGSKHESPLKETATLNPVSPYGTSKHIGEQYCNLYHNTYGLPVTIVRLFNIYGPRQRKYLMYDLLTKLTRDPTSLSVLGTGEEKRDFVYVEDAADALIHMSVKKSTIGQTFNLGTRRPTSTKEVVNYIIRLLQVNPVISFTGSSWKGDINWLVADTSKLSSTGFRAKTTVESGLNQLFSWYQTYERKMLHVK